jgi:amidase
MDDVHRLAAELTIKISDIQDAEDYLLLLQSLESVLKHVEDSDDYIHPLLQPQPTVASRAYWRPEQKDNPLNGWSHRCELEAANLGGDSLKAARLPSKITSPLAGFQRQSGRFRSSYHETEFFRLHPLTLPLLLECSLPVRF